MRTVGAVALRPWRPADAPALAAAWADPDIARWTAVPEDRSVEAAARWIAGWDERRRRGLALDLS
jgi:RimJ/RimL family protein N-acetyltransferase